MHRDEGYPHLHRVQTHRADEAFRGNADDRDRRIRELDHAADDARVPVVPCLPQLVADHGDRYRGVASDLAGLERSTKDRMNTERREEVVADIADPRAPNTAV